MGEEQCVWGGGEVGGGATENLINAEQPSTGGQQLCPPHLLPAVLPLALASHKQAFDCTKALSHQLRVGCREWGREKKIGAGIRHKMQWSRSKPDNTSNLQCDGFAAKLFFIQSTEKPAIAWMGRW